ncbi:MAG: hypothetical protein RL077_4608 [Verrucomicrobiota bacterium]
MILVSTLVSTSDPETPKPLLHKQVDSWRRGSELNRRIEVLQTSALPLGYRALPENA